jgi:hypothetical protein
VPDVGAARLAALVGAVAVAVAAALTNRVGFSHRQTLALAILVIAGLGCLAIPSLRAPAAGHAQLQSVLGALGAALLAWLVITVLVVNATVESFLLGLVGFVFSLAVPAIHGANATSPFSPPP